eukprot:9725-Heterococcus_DN1.PRE.8
MKASATQVACVAAVVGAAALYHHSRKTNRAQLHALSFEGEATSNIGWPASSDVMNDSFLVQHILDFVGPGQHLYVSTVSKLVHQCYSNVQAIERLEFDLLTSDAKTTVVYSQMTLYSEMCKSKSRLMLAAECGVQFASQGSMLGRAAQCLLAVCSSGAKEKLEKAGAQDPQKMHKLMLSRCADKALLTFAFNHLGIDMPLLSPYLTLGATISGDLDKLQWLCLVHRAPLCVDSSMLAARYGHANILKWLNEIKAPIDAATCCEAAYHGHLPVLQLLYAKGHVWHDNTACLAAAGGHLHIVQWLSKHGFFHTVNNTAQQAAYFGAEHILDWLLTQPGALMDAGVLQAAATAKGVLGILMCAQLQRIAVTWMYCSTSTKTAVPQTITPT